MSDIPIILGMVFFSGFIVYMLAIAGKGICERDYYTNQTVEGNSSIAITGWWDYAIDIYERMTFRNCKGVPSWLSALVLSPIVVTASYIILRLIRGGG